MSSSSLGRPYTLDQQWAAGTTEPSSRLQWVTDSTAEVQVPPGVGLVNYVSSTATATLVLRVRRSGGDHALTLRHGGPEMDNAYRDPPRVIARHAGAAEAVAVS